MDIGNAYRRSRNALYLEKKKLFAVTVQLDNSKAKNCPKYQSISYTLKILVPDYGTGFSKLVPANTNSSATLIENPTNCRQNVYFRFGLTACAVS